MKPDDRRKDVDRTDLQDVLKLVKEKLSRDAEAACGIFWADMSPTTRYAVGEEDAVVKYGIFEPQ